MPEEVGGKKVFSGWSQTTALSTIRFHLFPPTEANRHVSPAGFQHFPDGRIYSNETSDQLFIT
jgi:hypothetical protein